MSRREKGDMVIKLEGAVLVRVDGKTIIGEKPGQAIEVTWAGVENLEPGAGIVELRRLLRKAGTVWLKVTQEQVVATYPHAGKDEQLLLADGTDEL